MITSASSRYFPVKNRERILFGFDLIHSGLDNDQVFAIELFDIGDKRLLKQEFSLSSLTKVGNRYHGTFNISTPGVEKGSVVLQLPRNGSVSFTKISFQSADIGSIDWTPAPEDSWIIQSKLATYISQVEDEITIGGTGQKIDTLTGLLTEDGSTFTLNPDKIATEVFNSKTYNDMGLVNKTNFEQTADGWMQEITSEGKLAGYINASPETYRISFDKILLEGTTWADALGSSKVTVTENFALIGRNGVPVLDVNDDGLINMNVSSLKVGSYDALTSRDRRDIESRVGDLYLADKTGVLSGNEIYTDKADDSVVHVEVDGKSYQDGVPTPDHPIKIHSVNDFDVVSSVEKLSEGQLEEYNYDTEYGNIDKINLSLGEPLRNVGDVKDRLFRDSDGLWKVERNVGESVVDGSEDITTRTHRNGTQSYVIIIGASNILYIDSNINMTQSSHYVGRSWRDLYHGQDGIGILAPYVRVGDDRFSYDINLFRTWLSEQHAGGNPLTVRYHIEPTIEVLDRELQSKLNNLRSFENSNYVYVVDKNNLKPNLNVVFKSKGWKHKFATDKLESDIVDKVDTQELESTLMDLQQELAAAATSGELSDFVERYNKDLAARESDKQESENSLAKAQNSIDLIVNEMGDRSESWNFLERNISNTPEGIVIGSKSDGSYILIKEDRISFYSNGNEVAFFSQNLLEITRGAFVEEIQIAGYKLEGSTADDHLTFRYVGAPGK